ncbi:MAG: translation initiation factor IF-2 [Candidatus Omnitrophica bacterium]|nr:translation initiation factor IF-2 [Candidatus Omnitrophota bacterium]
MRIADLAQELKITEDYINDKIKSLKLRSKEGGELTSVVEMIIRDALADEGIGQKIVDEPEPKKAARKPKATPTADKPKAKASAAAKVKKPKAAVVRKKTALEADDEPMEEKKSQKEPLKPETLKASEETVLPVKQPVADKQVVVPPSSSPIQAPKDPVKKVEAPKAAALVKPVAPVIDVTKIDLPKEMPPVDGFKKKVKYDEPFVAVKPLAKKRKKSVEEAVFGGLKGRDHRPSDSIAAAVVPDGQPAGPLVDLELPVPISVKDFAVRVNQKMNVVLKKLLGMGVFANINQNLGEDIVAKLAHSFGFNLVKSKTQEEELIDVHAQQKDDPSLLKPRAPVVTFMGHVDHGKTSLLDAIRGAHVADSEHGGITQHIGAYLVESPNGNITFLDTPGHEAFTAMRARGAHITDIVVLVIAADDGIMPQTEEAIDHARAANAPIVVALNKIDKKAANIDRVKKQLSELDLMPEDWGGKIGVVGVSALTNEGVNDLLARILLEAEVLELRANPDKKALGIVIEAHMSKGRGAVASLIVQNGTLREGDAIVVGPLHGKIKAMFNSHGRPIQEAGPSMPVEVLGLSEVASAGEIFYCVEDEKSAKEIAWMRQEKLKNEKLSGTAKISLEDLYSQIQQGEIKELRVIIKADVQGSLEALKESLSKIPSDEVKLRFIHAAVGDVNASDVVLANASKAIIIAFQVAVDQKARQELENNPVDVREYRIIYDAVEDLRKALEGLLAPKLKRHFVGRAEVRNVFKLTKAGIVAGCYVQKGKIRNKIQAEVLRNGDVAHTGHVSTLKRFKDDVKEVTEGFECGITVSNFDTIAVGDIIEVFDIESIARKL